MQLRQTLLEIVSRIRETNLNNSEDPIPTSDMIHRKLCADIESNPQKMQAYLRMLAEAHHIFIVKIVEPDTRLKIQGVSGYVACEVQILARLREVAARKLEQAYASQLYQRKQASAIVKELLPQARQLNNTPMGNFLNISVMLQQFEHFLATSFAEFTDSWKKNRLNELLSELDPASLPDDDPGSATDAPPGVVAAAAAAEEAPARAVDHADIARIEEMDRGGQWGEAVDKFGVEFLVRIHLRKCEFEKVKTLIRQRKIAREVDLRFVRDAVMKMEERVHIDPRLERHRQAMADVRRAAQQRISHIFSLRRQMGDSGPGIPSPAADDADP